MVLFPLEAHHVQQLSEWMVAQAPLSHFLAKSLKVLSHVSPTQNPPNVESSSPGRQGNEPTFDCESTYVLHKCKHQACICVRMSVFRSSMHMCACLYTDTDLRCAYTRVHL